MRAPQLVSFAGLCAALVCLAAPAASARDRITVYEHVGYGGASRVITRDEPNLVALGFNDTISSIRVEDGTWEACEHVNYGGRCFTLRRDRDDLVADGFNDRISSIRKIGDRRSDRDWDRDGDRGRDWDRDGDRGRDWDRDGDRGRDSDWRRDPSWDRDSRWDPGWDRWIEHGRWGDRPDITLYEDVNFRGDKRRLDGNVRNLQNVGFNDRISSIRVRSGVWEVCEHSNFGGRCITIDRDVPSLVFLGFNDRVSSIRRVR